MCTTLNRERFHAMIFPLHLRRQNHITFDAISIHDTNQLTHTHRERERERQRQRQRQRQRVCLFNSHKSSWCVQSVMEVVRFKRSLQHRSHPLQLKRTSSRRRTRPSGSCPENGPEFSSRLRPTECPSQGLCLRGLRARLRGV